MSEYLAAVERFFVLLRQRGLMLSAEDVELVLTWEEAGLPLEVVCRALARGAEILRERNGAEVPLPDRLSYYRVFVEQAAEAHRELVPMNDPEPDEAPAPDAAEAGHDLAWIGQMETEPRLKRAYEAAWRAIESLGDMDRETALLEGDRAAVDALIDGLSEAEAAEVTAVVEERLAPEAGRLGKRGLAVRRRALLEDELSARYGLVRLSELDRRRGSA